MSKPSENNTTGAALPIVIMGSGRSGTTWVLDSLAKPNRLKTVFEPLNSQCIPRAAAINSLFLSPNADAPVAHALLKQILQGKLRSVWADYRINPGRLHPREDGWKSAIYNVLKLGRHIKTYWQPGAKGLAIKFIRANLLLPWICSNFDVRALLVARHPCAVVASRLALGGPNWQPERLVEHYREQLSLMQLLNKEFSAPDPMLLKPAAALAWIWCVENVLPMNWANEYGYSIVFYENLLASPDQEWVRVAADLGLEKIPDATLRKTPSQQVSRNMQNKTFDVSHVSRWRDKLSSQQIDEIDQVLQAFRVSHYQASDPMPRRVDAGANLDDVRELV